MRGKAHGSWTFWARLCYHLLLGLSYFGDALTLELYPTDINLEGYLSIDLL